MDQRPSPEATSSSASQEIRCSLWNPKIHDHVHISPTPVHILRQINPSYTISCYLSKIRSNNVLPSKPMSSKWILSLVFFHQNPACLLHFLHKHHTLLQYYSSTLYLVSNTTGEGPQHGVFSILLIAHIIFLSCPLSNTQRTLKCLKFSVTFRRMFIS